MMKIRATILACALMGFMDSWGQSSRATALTSAKDLTATVGSTSKYYMVSSIESQMIRLKGDNIEIGGDTYAKDKVKIHFRTIPHYMMDEDSVTFFKAATLNHTLLAFRRTFNLNEWHSIVLPYDLTGRQIRQTFGEDAQLAVPKSISDDDPSAVEYQTLDLMTDDVVLTANKHYLLRPTKEPDVATGKTLSNFYTTKIEGPLYLIPDVSMKKNQSPSYHSIKNSDKTTQVQFRGTYNALDGTNIVGKNVKNKKVAPGVYTLDEERQAFVLNEDSVIVKGFRSWAIDNSPEPRALKFYVDGVELTDDITSIDNGQWTMDNDESIYDLSGRRIATPNRRGIYIINGKKVVVK